MKEFLKKHKFSKPEKYLKEWTIIFDQGDVPTGLEHDMKARMQMFKYPANIKVNTIATNVYCYQRNVFYTSEKKTHELVIVHNFTRNSTQVSVFLYRGMGGQPIFVQGGVAGH